MRAVVYVVAVLAAVGIGYVIATRPPESTTEQPVVTASASSEAMAEAGTLKMSVPTMHCEFGCYPTVKEAIESVDGVEEVTLDEQKEEGVIDNRQVLVKYQQGFDPSKAIAALGENGFKDANVVQ